MSFKHKYLVTNIPWYWRPLVWMVSYTIGGLHALYFALVYHTSHIKIIGQEKLDPNQPYIFGIWHTNVYIMFTLLPKIPQKQVWMQHPFWYMKPVHATLRCVGVEYVLGSTGHGGQAAADKLVEKIQSGYSTVVFPDGPNGPPKQLKKGLLHMAAQSGVPVVPLHVSIRRYLRANTWDTKRIPLPFSTLTLTIGEPYTVSEVTEAAAKDISAQL